MTTGFLADLVLMMHLAFIIFVVLGGLLVLRWKALALLHIPCAAWGVGIELGGWLCPLTALEVSLRQSAGEAGYHGGFVDYYIMPLVYPPGLTRELQILLGVGVLMINGGVYGTLLYQWFRRRSDR